MLNQTTYTFDIFDTVLTRIVIRPSALFLLLGQRLHNSNQIEISAQEFSDCRRLAEKKAYQDVQGESATLEEIYGHLAVLLELDEQKKREICDAELALEKEVIRAVPQTASRINELHREGKRIAYLSDMYMPSSFLIELLKEHGIWQEGDQCYVSCEYRGWKKDGKLFKSYYENEEVIPSQIEHQGNHPVADVIAPKKMGIKIKPYLEANPNRFEQRMSEDVLKTGGASSVLAGTSRWVRLNVDARSTNKVAIRDIAAGVAAPMLVSYVGWILKQASEQGIKRLYFVSRDGQILYEMAKRIAGNHEFDIEIKYLYASRQACQLAALDQVTELDKKWILTLEKFITLRIFLERFDTCPEDISIIIEKYGFHPRSYDAVMNQDDRIRVAALIDNEQFQNYILERAAVRRESFDTYLKQEGLYDDPPMAIVDVGWRGFLHYSISKMVKRETGKTIKGFYLGLWPEALSDEYGTKEAYLFDRRKEQDSFSGIEWQLYAMAEAFCSADHELVNGYYETEEKAIPTFKTSHEQPIMKWGLPIMRQSLVMYVEELVQHVNPATFNTEIKDSLVAIFKMFYLQPTKNESKAWGSFPYQTDQMGVWSFPLARPYRFRDLLSYFQNKKLKSLHNDHWHLGSLRLSSKPIRAGFRIASKVHRLQKKINYQGILSSA